MVGPTWWTLAQAMRQGVTASRARAFRPLFRFVDAGSRASRTLPRLAVLGVTVAAVLIVVVAPTAIDSIKTWLGVLAVAIPAYVLADKFLFWDSAVGARLHVRTDANPLEEVAAHCTWIRRWAGRPPLPGWQPTVVRLGLLLWVTLTVRLASAGTFPPLLAEVRRWLADLAVGLPWLAIGLVLLAAVSAAAEHAARAAFRPGAEDRSQPRPLQADPLPQGDGDSPSRAETGPPPSERRVMLAIGLGYAVVVFVIVAVDPSDWVGGWAAAALIFALLAGLAVWGAAVLRRWLDREKRPLLFVVDDLDRCRSDKVVETLESIQTLMRQPAPATRRDERWFRRLFPPAWTSPAPLVFMVLADGRWIRAAFEEHYAAFVDDVKEEGRPLGHLFLDKFFQLSITTPAVPRSVLDTYLAELTREPTGTATAAVEGPPSIEAPAPAQGPTGAQQPTREEVERLIEASASQEELLGSDIQQAKARLSLQDRADLSVRQVERFHDEALQVQTEHRLLAYVDLIEPNPRSVIRLINAYEVNRAVVAALELVADDELLDRLARWTILTIRWPAVGEALREAPALLDDVAASQAVTATSQDVSWTTRPDSKVMSTATTDAVALLGTEDVRRVLRWQGRPLRADDVRAFTGILDHRPASAG